MLQNAFPAAVVFAIDKDAMNEERAFPCSNTGGRGGGEGGNKNHVYTRGLNASDNA